MKLIKNILDGLLVVLCAFIFSQGPQFIQQYTQRLGGHVAELQRNVDMMRHVAELSGKNLDQYLQKFQQSTDPTFVHQGVLIEKIINRSAELTAVEKRLQAATPLNRPWIFISNLQPDIIQGTLKDYQPGISLTMEGLFYVFAGILFAKLLSFLLGSLMNALLKPLKLTSVKNRAQ